ncbi:MAG: hypothetical protein EBQ66_04595 [Flavobacteriia bacterium]|nr:hypothetical protein [Flavobacteriia bacterium]
MTDKIKAVGTKAEVFHGTAKHTSGNLHKKDLMKHKGRIVSRKKHAAGKKAIKRLFALGYKPKKGTFKAMRKSMVNGRKKGTRKRGGGEVGDIISKLSAAVSGATPALGATTPVAPGVPAVDKFTGSGQAAEQ